MQSSSSGGSPGQAPMPMGKGKTKKSPKKPGKPGGKKKPC